jgi:heme/copper-type cytochrome/quinol oxidase subunit 2
MKYKILLLCLIVLSGCAAVKKEKALELMPPDTPVKKIKMTAEQFQFNPDVVRVKQDTHVVLEITSLDVTHGFKIDRYGINTTIPAKNKTIVEFYTREPGIYPFRCSHFCGIGHFGMKGRLIVEE